MTTRSENKKAAGLEAGALAAEQEKPLLKDQDSSLIAGGRPHAGPIEKMPSTRHLLFTFLVCFLVTFGLTTAISPRQWHRQPCRKAEVRVQKPEIESGVPAEFSTLLSAASPAALHDILHRYFPGRFKHGIYPSDRSAIEAVHRDDAALATSLVQMAKRDGTNSTSSPPSTSTAAPTTTSSPGTSSTSSSSPPPVSTNSNIPPTSSSILTVTTTSTTSTPSTTGMSSIAPPSSPSSSFPTTTSSVVTTPSSRPTSSGIVSSSSSRGGTTVSASKTSSSSVSLRPVTSTFTSTNPNGGVTVVTATSYVAAGGETSAATTTGPAGSLQNGATGGKPATLLGGLACAVIWVLLTL